MSFDDRLWCKILSWNKLFSPSTPTDCFCLWCFHRAIENLRFVFSATLLSDPVKVSSLSEILSCQSVCHWCVKITWWCKRRKTWVYSLRFCSMIRPIVLKTIVRQNTVVAKTCDWGSQMQRQKFIPKPHRLGPLSYEYMNELICWKGLSFHDPINPQPNTSF